MKVLRMYSLASLLWSSSSSLYLLDVLSLPTRARNTGFGLCVITNKAHEPAYCMDSAALPPYAGVLEIGEHLAQAAIHVRGDFNNVDRHR